MTHLTWPTRHDPPDMTHLTGPTRHNPPDMTHLTWPTRHDPPDMTHLTWPTWHDPPDMTHLTWLVMLKEWQEANILATVDAFENESRASVILELHHIVEHIWPRSPGQEQVDHVLHVTKISQWIQLCTADHSEPLTNDVMTNKIYCTFTQTCKHETDESVRNKVITCFTLIITFNMTVQCPH